MLRHWSVRVLMAALLGAPSAVFAFTTDGKFEGINEGYTLGFDISFSLEDGNVVDGGKVYFGTDTGGSGDHYLYFAMPKDFVDNSYGDGAIGWAVRVMIESGV